GLRVRARHRLRPPRRAVVRTAALMQLETERLLLRLPEVDDLEGYAAVFGDPEVTAFLGMGPQSLDENLAGIQLMRRHWDRHGCDRGRGTGRRGAGARGPARPVRPACGPLRARERRPRAVDLALGLAAGGGLEPLRDPDQRVEVHPGLHSLVLEQVDEVLGGDVAARARRIWAAAEAADRGIEHLRAGLERGQRVGVAGV